jgi:hypothetical protein
MSLFKFNNEKNRFVAVKITKNINDIVRTFILVWYVLKRVPMLKNNVVNSSTKAAAAK